jgi:FtsX-like permease family
VPHPQVYLSALQEPPARGQLLLRGSEDGVRAAVALLAARGYRPGRPRTVAEVRWSAAMPLVWLGRVAWVLGLVTLLLAMHGSHAAALQVTRRRHRELAVRRALGATDVRVLVLVLAGAARNALWGGALAVMLGTFLVGLVRRASAGVPNPGLAGYAVVVALLVAATLLASLKAAREAVATEPGTGIA